MTIETTRLSSKGQVIISESIRQHHRWPAGQEFIVEDTAYGVLLRPKSPFPQTTLEEVAGCLKYSGPPKTLAEMEDAIRKGVLAEGLDFADALHLANSDTCAELITFDNRFVPRAKDISTCQVRKP